MKKVAALAAAAVLAATMAGTLTGCGDSSHTITIFLLTNAHETEFYREYFKDLEAQLQEENLNYTIDFNGEQVDNYYTSLDADIAGGKTPDIFYVRPNELMQYKTEIVSVQDFADEYGFTTDTSKQIADLNDIYPTALNMYRFNPETGELGNPNDDLYAFPKDLSTQQLGYNRKLLAKYETQIKAQKGTNGKNLKMPWEMDFENENYTWDDFKLMCKTVADAITANGDANVYSCDIPSIEILAKSFGLETGLVDLSNGRANGVTADPRSGALHDAIEYQADFVNCGAGNYELATYANFSAGRVCFYGAVGSWEIADYNTLLNKEDDGTPSTQEYWGVMPWPTKDGSTDWQGLITSAGYVISKDCAAVEEKGQVAMRIALSFMSATMQDTLVRREQISLPLRMSVKNDYLDPANDDTYTPSTRKFFLDVVSGDHGFFPSTYSTYDQKWLNELSDALEGIWGASYKDHAGANARFKQVNWDNVAQRMQEQYDKTKAD